MHGTTHLEIDGWEVATSSDRWLAGYREHASLVDEFLVPREPDAGELHVAIGRPGEVQPSLVVAQTYTPRWDPGVLVVTSTRTVFVGAGTRLLCYRSRSGRWQRLWLEERPWVMGFWGWRQHGDHVLMSAELELGAWWIDGRTLWETFVEPPWDYEVADDVVHLDVMGVVTEFPIATGPRDRPARGQ